MTDEQRARLSIVKSNPSLEVRSNISMARKGRIVSQETGAKISASLMGHVAWNKGHHTSDATKAKIAAARWMGGSSIWRRKQKAKRRLLGFNQLNSWFPGCEGHHINPQDVIYIPRALHQSVRHNLWTGKNMGRINALAGQYMAEDWT
jgi:hypothetical protein